MIHIAIVDDDENSRMTLHNYLCRYQDDNGEQMKISIFQDGAEITENYTAKYDLLILDIQMRCMDGMRAAELIREVDKEVIIIFITNMSKYAIKGYAVQAMNYLLKPVSYFALSQELNKAINVIHERKSAYFVIRNNKGIIKLNVEEIVYIESKKHQIIVHTKSNSYCTRDSMKNVEKLLSLYKFNRCNNSYLVNLRFVESVVDNNVTVAGDELQISRPRKKLFMEELTDYVGGIT